MLEKMIDCDEKILWQGKPNAFLYIVGNPIIYPIAIVWGLFDYFFLMQFMQVGRNISHMGMIGVNRMDLFLLPFMLLHLLPVWIAVFGPIYRAVKWKSVEYAITEKRSYLISGIFGKDVTTIEHRHVENLTVNVNPIENMMGLGTVKLTPDQIARSSVASHSGNHHIVRGYRFISVQEPYEVYKLLKRVSTDVTTDQQYPNAYRPDKNPGYHTSLDDDRI